MIALKIFEVGILSSPSQLKCLQEIFKTDPYSNNEPSSQNIAKLWRTYSNSNHYGKYDDAILKRQGLGQIFLEHAASYF